MLSTGISAAKALVDPHRATQEQPLFIVCRSALLQLSSRALEFVN